MDAYWISQAQEYAKVFKVFRKICHRTLMMIQSFHFGFTSENQFVIVRVAEKMQNA